ncbi:MAG: HYExAFE family protein [Thermoguttaceae bacterium]|jgi:hypothetical protein
MQKNRYEVAFERYLRSIRRPYLSNRQERRFLLPDGLTLKNFDDIIQRRPGDNWIVDVKGRRFPSGRTSKRYWKNWTTRDDLFAMLRWEEILNAGGCQYRDRSAFVFAYLVVGNRLPLPEKRLFHDGGERFAFFIVPVKTYLSEARLISPRWQTYEMPAARFRKLAVPLDEFFDDAGTANVNSPNDHLSLDLV